MADRVTRPLDEAAFSGSADRRRVVRQSGAIVRHVGVMILAAAACGMHHADAEVIYSMVGTGVGANLATASGTDQNWNVVALPLGASGSVPYGAAVPRSTNANWIGGGTPQSGTSVSGTTYYWVSANSSASPLISGTYNYILSQTFTVSQSGTYEFNFLATVDNELTFYIDGSVGGTGTVLPDIVGGVQIGPTLSGTGIFRNIYSFTGTAALSAGTHTAYAVVKDWGAVTGTLITSSTFVAVPEPSLSVVGATATLVGGWVLARRRSPARRSMEDRPDRRPHSPEMNRSRFGNASNVAAGVPKFTASTSGGWAASHCDRSMVS